MRSKPSASVQHASQPYHSLDRRLRWSHPLPHTHAHTHRSSAPPFSFIPSSISRSSHSSSLETLIIPTIPRFISTIILFPLLSPFYLFPSFRGNMLGGLLFSPLRWLSISLQSSSTSLCHLSQGSSNLSEEPDGGYLGVPLHFTRPWCSAIGSILLSGAALPNPFSRDLWGESLCALVHYGISLHVWCKDREQTAHDLMCQLGKDTTDCIRCGMYILV